MGPLLRRFELGHRAALGVACVHYRMFLSIDYADGKIVPLVGSAESEPTADQPGTVFPRKTRRTPDLMFIGETQGQTGRTPISIHAPIRGLRCTKRSADSPSFLDS